MPRRLTSLSIFVSCPRDLDTERRLVMAAANDLNPLLEQTHGVRLEVISWPSDIIPGVGTDPQAVINAQAGDRYDIYVGILGTRFGSPTPRADSGTEEEFLAAYERYRAQPSKVRLLFYFKNSTDRLHELSLDDLAKIRQFRARLSENFGVLYADFPDSDEFFKTLRKHLSTLVATQWRGEEWITSEPSVPGRPSGEVDVQQSHELTESMSADEEVAGILDLTVEAQEQLATAGQGLEAITRLTKEITDSLNRRSEEVTAVVSNPPVSPTKARQIVNDAADDILDFAKRLQSHIALIRTSFAAGFGAIEAAVGLQTQPGDSRPAGVESLEALLVELDSVLRTTRGSTLGFKNAVAALPGLTSRLKKARRNVSARLDELLAFYTIALDRVAALRERLDGLHA